MKAFWRPSVNRPSNQILMILSIGLLVVNMVTAATNEPIRPLPEVKLDKAKVELGRRLFHEPRLSKDNSISCASCHMLDRGGVDGRQVSIGVGGAEGPINSPTVLNSGLNFRQFWDGRAATLEEQVEGPVHADAEMASSWPEVIGKLRQDEHYVNDFTALYGSEITSAAITDAIATFERSLLTPSRFDDYLQGVQSALSAAELQGYQLFKIYGCVACHQGANVGGNMFQYFGVMGNYFRDRGNLTEADYGRYNVTGNERDKFLFKVPSLRNIALTAPYFHDGSVATLEGAVDVMIKYQLGRNVSQRDRDLIVQFLHSLTSKDAEQSPPISDQQPAMHIQGEQSNG